MPSAEGGPDATSKNRDPYYNRTGLIDLEELIKKNGDSGGIPTSAGAKLRHQVCPITYFLLLLFVRRIIDFLGGQINDPINDWGKNCTFTYSTLICVGLRPLGFFPVMI